MSGMRLNRDGAKVDRTADAWRDSFHEAAHETVAWDFGWSVQPARRPYSQPGPVALYAPRVLRRSRSGAWQSGSERFLILLAGAAASEDVGIDVPASCSDDIQQARQLMRHYNFDESISDGMRIVRAHTRRLWSRIVLRADEIYIAHMEAKGARS